MVTHSCHCGKSFTSLSGSSYPTVEAEAAGFTSIFVAYDGLNIKWICPACLKICQPAFMVLLRILGPEAKYMSFTSLLTETEHTYPEVGRR